MAEELKPWDRQPSEGSKAYEHFQTYLDMGADRTLRGVADIASKSEQYIRALSTRYNWQDRTRLWDSMPRRAVASAYEDMAARIADQHERVATKLMSRLEQHLDLLPEGKVPSQTWSIAHGAGRQGHQFATELSKPADTRKAEITDAIENLISKLAGEG